MRSTVSDKVRETTSTSTFIAATLQHLPGWERTFKWRTVRRAYQLSQCVMASRTIRGAA